MNFEIDTFLAENNLRREFTAKETLGKYKVRMHHIELRRKTVLRSTSTIFRIQSSGNLHASKLNLNIIALV